MHIFKDEYRDDPLVLEAQADIVDALLDLAEKHPETISELNHIASSMIWLGDRERFAFVDLYEILENVAQSSKGDEELGSNEDSLQDLRDSAAAAREEAKKAREQYGN